MTLPLLLIAAQISILLVDRRSGEVIEQRWDSYEYAVPVGSLVKPFTALAYAQRNGFEYPIHKCVSGCWLPRGHGRIGIEQAIAQSCNTYFRRLADGLTADDVAAVTSRFGLPGPPPGSDSAALIGIGSEWAVPPLVLLRAYRELALRKDEPGVAPLLGGMRLSAKSGTGVAAGRDALIKTGTAPCIHGKQPGDGFAMVLEKDILLLVGVEGRPGSHAAGVAGRVLGARQ
jgi:hypothetical protein